MDYDVIVAGAGPVGLLLAGELALAGVRVLVLERLAEPDQTFKDGAMGARSVNAPTADALHRRGLLPAVRAAAIQWFRPDPELLAGRGPGGGGAPPFVGHFAGLPIRADRVDFADPDLAGNSVGGGVIPQHSLEKILAGHAAATGVELRRGVEVTGVRPTDDSVTVEAGGELIRAGWLVGCDGGRSSVRKLAGFDFPGIGPEFTGRQALVELDDPARLPMGGWVRTAEGSYVHGPVPGRIHTVQYDSGSSPTDRSSPVSVAELQTSLRTVTGTFLTITRLHTATRYTDQTRQATTYRRGRVLLAGDAAHVHSPAGGQGLNLGLGDAMNLGWKLASTVDGRAPAGLLDSYTAERHPIGAWVQNWSNAQSALGRPDARTAALRDVVTDLLDTGPGATYVLKQISGLAQHYDLPGHHPLTGRRAPELMLVDGRSLAQWQVDGRAVFVDGTDSAVLREAVAPWCERVTMAAAAMTVHNGLTALLVRPDGYVAWAADGTPDVPALVTALHTWFGAAG